MKTQFLSWSVGMVLSMTTTAILAQDQAPAPSYKDGDSWQFNVKPEGQQVSSSERFVGIFELVYSQGQLKVFEVNGDRKTELDIKAEGPGSGLANNVGYNEQRPSLKFPLSVGQKWKYEYVNRPAGARQDQKRSVEVTVSGIEQVTTPAGSFKAYKLVRKEEWQAAGKQVKWRSSSITYFYSPDTRSVVKSSTVSDSGPGSSNSELIKFTPGN
jgi:hypothetical protein